MSLVHPIRPSRVSRSALLLAAVTVLISAAVLLTPLAGSRFGWYFDDLGALAVAAVATACGIWRSRTSSDAGLRRSWALIAAGCATWTLGEALWSWFELGLGQDPFPSIADIGYLGFPVAACAALLVYPAEGGVPGGGRRVLDALMAIGSLALISWETVLGAVVRGHVEASLSFGVSVAYPLTDLVVIALVILTFARVRTGRLSLTLMTAGCTALAISDSLFAYLTATTGYTGGAVDLGWIAAFVLLALAALSRDNRPNPPRQSASPAAATVGGWTSILPYVPVIAACIVTVSQAAAGHLPSAAQLMLAAVVVTLLLTRQYLTLRRNNELTDQLANREAQLLHQAFHDSLTGLANRALFRDRLTHALELHSRDLRAVSVLFLDLDDFKLINDTLGHGTGDELLSRVAARLVGAVRNGDTVARLGGDEFAVLIEDDGDPVAAAAKLLDALQTPFVLAGQWLDVRASVGVFELAAHDMATSADQLLMHADTAMYAAKRAGKNRITLYRDGMALTELEDDLLAQSLAEAIDNGDLRLVYQPIVDLSDGSINGLEALARWRHAGTDIGPDVFIPLAERTGVISQLTTHVLRCACAQLEGWAAMGHEQVSVAVNVPPAQITAPGFARGVGELLERHGLGRGQLTIEITESGAFSDVEAARGAIGELRRLGVGISLDDFGVGQSSLAQLHNVELDSVKIDKSFIATLDSDPRQATFLRALLRMSTDIGLKVIVEGVERPEQLAQLRKLGNPFAQGYLFARPLPAADCLRLLGVSAPFALLAGDLAAI